MRSVALTARVRDAAADHAAGTYPYEGCGLLIGYHSGDEVRVSRLLPCPNVAPPERRSHFFMIDPRVVINVRRSLRGTQEQVVGFYHSHPDAPAAPSATDMEYIRLWPETVWLIVPVEGGEPGEARGWWLDQPEDERARELAVETIPVRTTAVAACPE